MMSVITGIGIVLLLTCSSPFCSAHRGSQALSPECNNHGTILPAGHCRCYDNWYGRKCEKINRQHAPMYVTSQAVDPECNNHGKLQRDGRCHCYGNWFGRKCEQVKSGTSGSSNQASGHTGSHIVHPYCNNHGTLQSWGVCRCNDRWTGRKCETLRNAGQLFLDPRCNNHGTLMPGNKCRCHGNWFGRKCELIRPLPWYQVQGKQSTRQTTMAASKTTKRLTSSFFTTTKSTQHKNTALASTQRIPVTFVKNTPHSSATTSSSVIKTFSSKNPATLKSATPTTTADISTVQSKSSITSDQKPVKTTQTTPSILPNISTKSSSTKLLQQKASTSSATSTTTAVSSVTTKSTRSTASSSKVANPSSLYSKTGTTKTVSNTKPIRMFNTTFVQPSLEPTHSTTIIAPTNNFLSVTSGISPPQTTPPVTRECAVCAGPAFLCEKLFITTQCKPPNNYCINTIINHRDGTKSVNRTCGSFDTCYREWYVGTSDNDKCRKFSGTEEQRLDFQCSFCCVEDNCNVPLHPAGDTLYKPV